MPTHLHWALHDSNLSCLRTNRGNSEKLNDSAVGVPSNFRILQLLPPIPVPLKLSFPSSPECLNSPQFKKTKLDEYQRGTLSKLANEPFLLFAQITFPSTSTVKWITAPPQQWQTGTKNPWGGRRFVWSVALVAPRAGRRQMNMAEA